MDNRSKIRRFLSIRTVADPTWYLAVLLITGIMVTQYPGSYALRDRIFWGLLGGVLFLTSMAVVQFLTNFVAIMARIGVRNATLFVFGGVAQVPEDSTTPGRETIAAGATLLLNLMMALTFNWLYAQRSLTDAAIVPLLQWMAFFWYMLAIFHLIPAFPLAGGRLLSAIIWKASDNYSISVRIATALGWVLGAALILWGVWLLILSGQVTNGLMLIFFGWALERGATSSNRRAALLAAMQHTRAKHVMSTEFPVISHAVTLEELAHQRILITGQDFFAVTEQGHLLGIATAADIKRVPKNRWQATTVGKIMIRDKKVRTASAEEPAGHLLEQMDQFRVDRLPVLEDGKMIGVVVRESLYRLARVRTLLKI